MSLLLFCLMSFGAWYCLGRSVISLPLRKALADLEIGPITFLLNLIECPACFGFWWGFFLALGVPDLVGFIADPSLWVTLGEGIGAVRRAAAVGTGIVASNLILIRLTNLE